jgi:DNA-binding beta-propeller fold protein YncE
MRPPVRALVAASLVSLGCGESPVPAAAPGTLAPLATPAASSGSVGSVVDAGPSSSAGPTTLAFKAFALPGASAPAPLDYLAYEPAHDRVWVPVGNTGSVDVYDIASGAFTLVSGFKTAEREDRGKKRTMGPSSVAIGDGVAYVGNRADSSVCAVDTATLKLGTCLTLGSSPDGVAYEAFAKEVWVTTPRDNSIAVLDASKPGALAAKTTIKVDGAPEGYASDANRGVFVTNLEDRNKTVVIDVAAHQTKTSWSLGCDSKGPRGVATDTDNGIVFVACTDHMEILDGTHGGGQLARFDTGGGVDNIAWLPSRRLLYAAAGGAARVTVARIDPRGHATIVATGTSVDGARNPVADESGNMYVADGANARLLVFGYSP